MDWSREFDIIVIGSGGSGMMAASRAAHEGAKVLLVEKSQRFGGTTALSGGCIWVPANHLQANPQKDSPQLALKYLKNLTKGSVEDSILETYIEQSPKMLRFLDKESRLNLVACEKYCDYYPEVDGGLEGSRTVEPDYFDGQSLKEDRKLLRDPQKLTLMFGKISLTAREAHHLTTSGRQGKMLALKKASKYFLNPFSHRRHGRDRNLALGQSLVAGMWAMMRSKNVTVDLNTSVSRIISDTGRVIGIETKSGDQTESIGAKSGIILACGGFSRNQAFKQKHHGPNTQASWGAAVSEDTGDAYQFCQELAPATALMDEAWWMPVMKVPGEDFARSIVVDRSLPGSIVVDMEGHRFTNESAPYEDFVKSMFQRKAPHTAWLIVDAYHRKKFPLGPLLPGAYHPKSLWPAELKTWIKSADSVSGLAKEIDVNQKVLEATITEFNQNANQGQDPKFGRGQSAYDRYYADQSVGQNPCLKPLEAPYYAVKLYPGDLGSKGGFVVNERAQVLNQNQEPIEGLYAAGNAAANPLGNIYPGAGGTLGPGLTFGYIAAETALQCH